MPGGENVTEQILAVNRMQEYIEAHLDEEITMEELASVSLYSPWYSYRLFREHTGMTVADYVRRLRLSKSAMRLKEENVRITDVALQMGFGSVHESGNERNAECAECFCSGHQEAGA